MGRILRCAASIGGLSITEAFCPQFLVEKVIRTRIWDSQYWKEQCFALTAVSLIDRAAEVHYVGGTFGGHNRPCEFICLALKLLQLQPEKEIILEYLRAEDFK